jgi:hypothetical protein
MRLSGGFPGVWNAIRHTPNGGQVTITTVGGEWVTIDVADTVSPPLTFRMSSTASGGRRSRAAAAPAAASTPASAEIPGGGGRSATLPSEYREASQLPGPRSALVLQSLCEILSVSSLVMALPSAGLVESAPV